MIYNEITEEEFIKISQFVYKEDALGFLEEYPDRYAYSKIRNGGFYTPQPFAQSVHYRFIYDDYEFEIVIVHKLYKTEINFVSENVLELISDMKDMPEEEEDIDG